MKRNALMIAAGVLVTLASIWIGCWAHHLVGGILAWQSFPIFTTTVIGVLCGILLITWGTIRMLNSKKETP